MDSSKLKVEEISSDNADLRIWSPRPIPITFSDGGLRVSEHDSPAKSSKGKGKVKSVVEELKVQEDASSPSKEQANPETRSKSRAKKKGSQGGCNLSLWILIISAIIGLFYLRYYVGDRASFSVPSLLTYLHKTV
jgi:uncharacterized membrane protein